MTDQDKINTKRVLDYIRKNLQNSLEGREVDPDRAKEIISRTIRENLPKDSPIRIKEPTTEQLVALRLMGEDIRNTLHFSVEIVPKYPLDFVQAKVVVGNKTE